METIGFALLLRSFKIVKHEVAIALLPFLAISVAAEPAFALKEMQEDDASKQPLHEIAQRLAGAIKFLFIRAHDGDAEDFLRRIGVVNQVFNEVLVMLLVFCEE